VLTQDEARSYWDVRHREQSPLRSGGDLSYDEAGNELFYRVRLGRLLDALTDLAASEAPLRLLDAGCGKGWFARELARCGHAVQGIDVSASALAAAAESGGGPSYARSTLAGWRSPLGYDAVYSIDVLFHLLDDAEWEASVRNLAAHVRPGGRLVLADWGGGERRAWGDYQVTRPRGAYLDLVPPLGFRDNGFRPYGFRDNATGLHVFTRWR
jgi:2-polyprenyl-3-methyl-5-hydroxy-6-metoxy-1,4-benzoquinol methylase